MYILTFFASAASRAFSAWTALRAASARLVRVRVRVRAKARVRVRARARDRVRVRARVAHAAHLDVG